MFICCGDPQIIKFFLLFLIYCNFVQVRYCNVNVQGSLFQILWNRSFDPSMCSPPIGWERTFILSAEPSLGPCWSSDIFHMSRCSLAYPWTFSDSECWLLSHLPFPRWQARPTSHPRCAHPSFPLSHSHTHTHTHTHTQTERNLSHKAINPHHIVWSIYLISNMWCWN